MTDTQDQNESALSKAVKVATVTVFLMAALVAILTWLGIAPHGPSPSSHGTDAPTEVTSPSIHPSTTKSSSERSTAPPSSSSGKSPMIASKAPQTTVALHRIPVSYLCNAAIETYICGSDYEKAIQIGNRMFTYVGQGNSNAVPPYWTLVFGHGKTTCNQIVIQFGMDDNRAKSGAIANIEVIQGSTAAQVAQTSTGHLGKLTASLDGSPFTINAQSTDGTSVVVNGFALCTTASGQ